MALVRNLERIRFSKLPPLSEVPRIVDPPTDVFNRYFVDRGSPVIIDRSIARSRRVKSITEPLRKLSWRVWNATYRELTSGMVGA